MSAVRKASAKLILLQNRDFSVIIYMFRFLLVIPPPRSVIGTIMFLQGHSTTSLGPQGRTSRLSIYQGLGRTPNLNEFPFAKYFSVP